VIIPEAHCSLRPADVLVNGWGNTLTAFDITVAHPFVAGLRPQYTSPGVRATEAAATKASEYTAVCPVTGQPDFGTLCVTYCPDKLCIELKSLKLYLWSFRDEGHYFEQAVNQILDDLVRACRPRWMTVAGRFNVRGGIATTVAARYPRPGRAARGRRRRRT
jgi:7-cyano-7-deazaguanine reductase